MKNKINHHVNNTYNQIINTYSIMERSAIFVRTIEPEIIQSEDDSLITWKNHEPGRYNCGKSFTTINQYCKICTNGSFNAMLYDGSIIRTMFMFKKNIIVGESLLFWPSPIDINSSELSDYGIKTIIDAYLGEKIISNELRMRSPFRYDFDSSNNTYEHPQFHIHMQHYNCRIKAKGPICFNTFLKFILSNFYPNIKFDYTLLSPMNYSYQKADAFEFRPYICLDKRHI